MPISLMKQSRMGESKERLVDILVYGWATSKDPDMLLLARSLQEAKLPNLSCRIDRAAPLFWATLQAAACFMFVAMVPSIRLACRSFASMRRSGLSLPIAIHFMG
ncbi:hypothetical protein, partial [Mesorhizobium sp.]|uniref:hypothetical protein n=1 Tax=Mesorhizobium sp. TaxID=1871066 RepID=UPI0025B91AD2